MTFAAIIPALNEEKTIRIVLQILNQEKGLREIIVVDDGSTDATARESHMPGVRLIRNQKNIGKGAAMRIGALASTADILIFFDADLVGMTPTHIRQLMDPFGKKNDLGMVVGLRDRYNGITYVLRKISPIFMLSGERAMKRNLFLTVSQTSTDFGIEVMMNTYCAKYHIPVEYVYLKGLDQVIKEIKYGFFHGFFARIRMIGQVIRAFIS